LPYLDNILSSLRNGLATKGKHTTVNEALACIGMVSSRETVERQRRIVCCVVALKKICVCV
jgi:hypothetical protein